jgi:hypothetical protein
VLLTATVANVADAGLTACAHAGMAAADKLAAANNIHTAENPFIPHS